MRASALLSDALTFEKGEGFLDRVDEAAVSVPTPRSEARAGTASDTNRALCSLSPATSSESRLVASSDGPHRQLGHGPRVFGKAARTEVRCVGDQLGTRQASQLRLEYQ